MYKRQAENNELALTDNGHGDICKYYSYDMHQMVPDLLVANYAFLNELSDCLLYTSPGKVQLQKAPVSAKKPVLVGSVPGCQRANN